MPRRRPGALLELEEQIIEIAIRRENEARPEFYGFALAEELGSAEHRQRLLGHGTLYKALSRLEVSGLLESRWEDVDTSEEGRPRRRLYRVTGMAPLALARSRAEHAPSTSKPRRWAVT